MAIRSKLVSDVELRLTQGKPSDDLELEVDLISHWLDVARNELVRDKILKEGVPTNKFYLKREVNKKLVFESDVEFGRYYFELDSEPMALPDDSGIDRITSDKGELILMVDYKDLGMLKNLKFSKPSRCNMMWYRDNNDVFLEGVTSMTAKTTTFEVFYIPNDIGDLDQDEDDFKVDPDMEGDILEYVEAIGLRHINQGIDDNSNDAKDE